MTATASEHPSASATPGRPGRPDYFVTTRWTEVVSAGGPDTPQAREALARLCQVYWYPLYVYVRRRGHSSHDAEDLTQGFFGTLLRLNSLADVGPARGKFRAFLLAAMKNHLNTEWKRASAHKRDARQTFSLEMDAAETRYHSEPSENIPPEWAFDRRWALTLLETVIQRLRREYELTGRTAVFHELRHAITLGKDSAPPGEVAARLGLSAEAVRVAAHRLRKRYRQMLREEIAATVADEAEVDAEMAYLRHVLTSG